MNTREAVVTAFGLLLLALVLASPVACTMNRQRVVAEAIKNGGDPIAVKCAIEADVDHAPMCVAAAMRGK